MKCVTLQLLGSNSQKSYSLRLSDHQHPIPWDFRAKVWDQEIVPCDFTEPRLFGNKCKMVYVYATQRQDGDSTINLETNMNFSSNGCPSNLRACKTSTKTGVLVSISKWHVPKPWGMNIQYLGLLSGIISFHEVYGSKTETCRMDPETRISRQYLRRGSSY